MCSSATIGPTLCLNPSAAHPLVTARRRKWAGLDSNGTNLQQVLWEQTQIWRHWMNRELACVVYCVFWHSAQKWIVTFSLTTLENPWTPLNALDHPWLLLTILDHSWPPLTTLDHPWPPLTTFGHPWPPLNTFDHPWTPLTTFDHLWPPLTTFDHPWPRLTSVGR